MRKYLSPFQPNHSMILWFYACHKVFFSYLFPIFSTRWRTTLKKKIHARWKRLILKQSVTSKWQLPTSTRWSEQNLEDVLRNFHGLMCQLEWNFPGYKILLGAVVLCHSSVSISYSWKVPWPKIHWENPQSSALTQWQVQFSNSGRQNQKYKILFPKSFSDSLSDICNSSSMLTHI